MTGAAPPTATGASRPAPADRAGPVRVAIDASAVEGELTRLWTSIGYDEINWTYTPRGRDLLATLAGCGDGAYLVRSHYMYCSGTGLGLPHWGAGNVYHERADGTPSFDFQVLDRAYDTLVEMGHIPIVELGFTPRALVPDDAGRRFAFEPGSPTQYSEYEAGWWSFPPKSLARWADLVTATAEHYVRRYGKARVAGWYWEVWNEPDIGYWRGSIEEYLELYRASAAAVRSVVADALVGGPATTGDLTPVGGLPAKGPDFLAAFLDFCTGQPTPLDFVTFHTKGAYFQPWRSYLPPDEASQPQSPSMVKMLREVRHSLRQVAERPGLADVECLADECDASVPAHHGRFDNSNFGYRNTEYFPVFQCCLMKKLLDLEEARAARLRAATAWAFYIEGERCFEGTRSLLTYGGIEKPVLNAYRLLGRLGSLRLRATSTAAWPVRLIDEARSVPEEVDVLAATSGDGAGRVTALVWRHDDDQHRGEQRERQVRVTVRGLGARPVVVRQWRIDAAHGNSYRAWQALGAPDYPDPAEIEQVADEGRLRPLEPERLEAPRDGEVVVDLSLRLPAVSLLELIPAGKAGGR
jgi:xylan 1,4-beta-xylosidase